MEKKESFGLRPLREIWGPIKNTWTAIKDLAHQIRPHLWARRKNLTIHFRRKLSRDLAVFLSLGMIFRESFDLFGFSLVPEKAVPWIVLPLALGTLLAAVWELRGNKLSDTPQDERFVNEMGELLKYLELTVLSDEEPRNMNERVNDFTERLLVYACATLCGKKKIEAATFLPNDAVTELALTQGEPRDNFQVGLTLPLPNGNQSVPVSPGVEAFRRTKPTYMPRKKKDEKKVQCSLLFEESTWKWTEHVHGWIATKDKKHEDFRSLLCIPVAPAVTEHQSLPFGLLTFHTKHRDPFVTLDFKMGRCFAKVLGQALTYARLKNEMNGLKDELKLAREENEKLKTELDNRPAEKRGPEPPPNPPPSIVESE